MTAMEYRAWIAVPGLAFEAEDSWEPAIRHLETVYEDFGPVVGWVDDGARFVLSTDAPSEAAAARWLYDAVADSLGAGGDGHAYATRVEIEAARADRLAAAA